VIGARCARRVSRAQPTEITHVCPWLSFAAESRSSTSAPASRGTAFGWGRTRRARRRRGASNTALGRLSCRRAATRSHWVFDIMLVVRRGGRGRACGTLRKPRGVPRAKFGATGPQRAGLPPMSPDPAIRGITGAGMGPHWPTLISAISARPRIKDRALPRHGVPIPPLSLSSPTMPLPATVKLNNGVEMPLVGLGASAIFAICVD
jgi:hypothetical protein